MSKALGRLKEAEILRQQALDYIIANPGAIGPEILAHLGWLESSGGSRILAMTEEGELRREPVEYFCMSGAHKRRQKTFAYFALVEKTKRAEDVLATLGRNLTSQGRAEAKKENKPRKQRPGVYVHNDPDRMAIPNQGGQGASKPRMATYLEVMA